MDEEKKTDETTDETPEVEITQGDRDVFFECMMGDTPFQKEFDLFDGRMKVTFRDRTTAEVDAITKVVVMNEPKTVVEMDTVTMRCSVACSLTMIKIDNQEISYELTPEEAGSKGPLELLDLRTKKITKFSRSKYAALCRLLAEFDALLAKMTEEARDPSFFSTTPGGTGG